MIKIQIGEDDCIVGNNIDEQWINQKIKRRQVDGLSVCVRVTIQERGLDIILFTPTCKIPSGPGSSLNNREAKVVELWEKCGLRMADFTGGNLIAFLKQFEHLF